MAWVKTQYPDPLPDAAQEWFSLQKQSPSHKIATEFLDKAKLWAVRLESPRPPGDIPEVDAEVQWTTDVALQGGAERLEVGIRVACASAGFYRPDILTARPGLVAEMADDPGLGLHEARPMDGRPVVLRDTTGLMKFVDFLHSQERRLPVIVLSQVNPDRIQMPAGEYILQPADLARRLIGLAYVIQIPQSMTFQWTQLVGYLWAAYNGTVRTYYPKIDFDEDQPTSHPRALAEHILTWQYNQKTGPEAFADYLAGKMGQYSADKRVEWGDLLFFPEARMKRVETARQEIDDAAGLVKLYEETVQQQQATITGLEQEVNRSIGLAEQAEKNRFSLEDENRKLKAIITFLRKKLAQNTGESPDRTIPIPQAFTEMPEWAEQHLLDRLKFHPRAIRGIKQAQYDDVELAYRSLILLAVEYRDMRLGMEGGRDKFDAACKKLGLTLSGSISRDRAGAEGDKYFVKYPVGSDENRFIEYHLRKGTSHDERYCFACYFFWDEQNSQVIVCWLPGHLPNKMT